MKDLKELLERLRKSSPVIVERVDGKPIDLDEEWRIMGEYVLARGGSVEGCLSRELTYRDPLTGEKFNPPRFSACFEKEQIATSFYHLINTHTEYIATVPSGPVALAVVDRIDPI